MKPSANILLVEDDQAMLDGMNDLLQTADIAFSVSVQTAKDGLDGLAKMAHSVPDLIVSDIMMPKMDGLHFLREVRENPDWIHIPFIFLTARGEKKDIRQGRLSGADLYLVKPFRSDELIELIESQLTRSYRLRETRQQDAENLKKGILQILNHEFRTPLTYVTAYYEMLADGISRFSDRRNLHEYLRGIQSGCLRLTGLVEDLIRVMELRTGETEAAFARRASLETDVGLVVEEAVAALRDKAEAASINIQYSQADGLPAVLVDRESLREALMRIIDNAIKFSDTRDRTGKEIAITTEGIRNEVHISVTDEGVGMPQHIEPRIFELFFQYNREVLEQQGAGIGLTIAKGLVDLHRGRIEVKSTENKGSKFTVVLAASVSELQPAPGASVQERIPATILVVEDDINLLEGLQELLEISGERYQYYVHIAEDGIAGLDVLKHHQPDLIISDIMMPKMGGYEFLREVRQNPNWLQIPFIFLTAKGERHEIHSGLLSGVEEYITKPYDSDELLDLVASKLDRYFQVKSAVAQSFDSLKRNILTLITPDFRLPLSSVTKFSEDLAQGFDQAQTEADLMSSLHGIQLSSLRLSELVEDFISMAELHAGEAETAFELNARPIDNVGYVLREAAQIWAANDMLVDLQIHIQDEENLPPVFGERKIILNCLLRVIEAGINHFHLNSDNNLYLSAGCAGEEVILSVGFNAQPEEHVLSGISSFLSSPDHSVVDTEFSADLMIAKGYIEIHGGDIRLEFENEQCCQFVISLPAYTPMAS